MGLNMAKENTIAAQKTPDLFPKKTEIRGRPKKPDALTNAQRQAKYRASRAAASVGDKMAQTIKKLSTEFDLTEQQVTRELLRFALCNRKWSQTGFNVTNEKGVSK